MGKLAWIAFAVWALGCLTNKKMKGAIHIFLLIAILLWIFK